MRTVSTITTIFAAASLSCDNIIPQDIATRGNPDKLAVLGALQVFLTDFSYPRLADVAKNITYNGFSENIVVDHHIFGFAAAVAELNTTLVIGYPKNLSVLSTLGSASTTTSRTYCLGENKQYATHAESVWTMGLDNTWVHFGMVKYRPSVHCPHIGPTGGDMCQDRTTGSPHIRWSNIAY
ncbi:hypothetical protein B0H15DRAFT_796524 [Mycena belliarum]|uniref:Uncharacterized protein n=1 Tax=Mycena belliarum TaxID=1033014 RepID=A0AAD6UEW6_9AGAR|nr:hypothetical protein B0H15DRAFT_796524 [Mycena belliae]